MSIMNYKSAGVAATVVVLASIAGWKYYTNRKAKGAPAPEIKVVVGEVDPKLKEPKVEEPEPKIEEPEPVVEPAQVVEVAIPEPATVVEVAISEPAPIPAQDPKAKVLYDLDAGIREVLKNDKEPADIYDSVVNIMTMTDDELIAKGNQSQRLLRRYLSNQSKRNHLQVKLRL